MSQIRFNMGVPRGGSAARSAEDSTESRLQSMRPQGGSAARMAEAQNRLQGLPARQSVSIGLRAQGGRPAGDTAPLGLGEDAAATVTRLRPELASPTLSDGPVPSVVPRSADPIAEPSASSRSPHTVPVRNQSLAKSLFSPDSSTKPN